MHLVLQLNYYITLYVCHWESITFSECYVK